MFCDELKIRVIAGNGGNGSVSFRREKFVAKGGPDGGDGGRGGSVIFRVNQNVNTLSHFSHQRIHKAEFGESGKGRNMHGKNGQDLIMNVPEGTMIFNENKTEMLADLDEEGKEFVVAKGGRGGVGNAHFTSATYQVPRFAETGEPGAIKDIVLELKLVADVGIIGLPSAGKSTLISVISNAKPKIAAYHFTTLIPNLGVVEMSQFGGDDSFVVADIPGLIEGASEGKGLGHKFLKHIARTKLLVHLIDGYLDNIGEDYKIINNELKAFDKNHTSKTTPKLSKLDQIIVINKKDVLDAETLKAKLKELKKETKRAKIFVISAVTRDGLKELMFEVFAKLQKIRAAEQKTKSEAKPIVQILQPHLTRVKFELKKVIKEKDHKVFEILGPRIEQLIKMTDLRNVEGLERVYHYMQRLGIKKAVDKAGANYGDFIQILDKRIPYRK
ncbi:MAG: GTPase ObgE [Patescibacteria group bacterium]